jgi:hypothetical protein
MKDNEVGRPVVATGWSGNMEYMNADVSFPVGYRLIPVKEGECPQGAGQVWAEPDIDAAAQTLARLVDDPAYARAVGERARIHMRKSFSDIVLGQRYRARLEAITARAGSSEALFTRSAALRNDGLDRGLPPDIQSGYGSWLPSAPIRLVGGRCSRGHRSTCPIEHYPSQGRPPCAADPGRTSVQHCPPAKRRGGRETRAVLRKSSPSLVTLR